MQLSMLPTALLALVPAVSAGYSYGGSDGSYSSGSSGSSGSSNGNTVSAPAPAQAANGVTVIAVGRNGQTMEPNDVTVPAGQTIEFHFYQGAHSVAQSAFNTPCTPLTAEAGNGTEGFFSGSQPVSSGEGSNVFRIVSTGSPMWYYCATQRHCQNGMVGVINKPASGARTLSQYAAAAAQASSNVAPDNVRGGTVAAINSPVDSGSTNGGSGNNNNNNPAGSAGVGSLSGLNLPVLALAAAAAVGLAL